MIYKLFIIIFKFGNLQIKQEMKEFIEVKIYLNYNKLYKELKLY